MVWIGQWPFKILSLFCDSPYCCIVFVSCKEVLSYQLTRWIFRMGRRTILQLFLQPWVWTWRLHSFSNVILRKMDQWREWPFFLIWYILINSLMFCVYLFPTIDFSFCCESLLSHSFFESFLNLNLFPCFCTGKWPYNWAYYHSSYCSYYSRIFGIWMWEACSCHFDRHEFLCWCSSWGKKTNHLSALHGLGYMSNAVNGFFR